jgi:hypothetical protein
MSFDLQTHESEAGNIGSGGSNKVMTAITAVKTAFSLSICSLLSFSMSHEIDNRVLIHFGIGGEYHESGCI